MMYGSEIDHVMMHLWRMERNVKGKLFTDNNTKGDEARLAFLVALKEAQDVVLRFRRATGDLSTTNLT